MAFRASAAAFLIAALIPSAASAEECGRAAFSKVVSAASAELTQLNKANKQRFHEKLQRLKDRAGWAEADYLKNATPFVKDDKIAAFDQESEALLARVPKLGGGSHAVASLAGTIPDVTAATASHCDMLEKLRVLMKDVVANSHAKWSYMLGKVDAALENAGTGPSD